MKKTTTKAKVQPHKLKAKRAPKLSLVKGPSVPRSRTKKPLNPEPLELKVLSGEKLAVTVKPKRSSLSLPAFGAVAALVLAITLGCAGNKSLERSQTPVSISLSESDLKPAASTALIKSALLSYTVKSGDTLWGLSRNFYKDSLQWPAIFKINRDKLEDPDLIYADQNLKVKKHLTPREIRRARKEALDTPQYAPHTEPRKKLPVDYV